MLFKQTFSKLTVSPHIIQEVIDMTETKKRPKKFVLRRLLVVAIVLALAFALAMGANAASNGELFKSAVSVFTFTSEDGESIAIAVNCAGLENTSSDAPMAITMQDIGGRKTGIGYKDKDGNFVLAELDVPEWLWDEIDMIYENKKNGVEPETKTYIASSRPATEEEAVAAEESDDVVNIGVDENNQIITATRIS